MATLPYSRVVNVTLSRNDAFPSRRGFGTVLFLTSKEIAGVLDASHRTKLYASMEEVAVDFTAADEAYKSAATLFSQNPRPIMFKVGFYDLSTAMSAADLSNEITAIINQDDDFYFLTVESILRDTPELDGAISLIQTKNKILIVDTNDIGHEDPNNTTCISARHKGTVDRTATFYLNVASLYPAVALAGYMATRSFDDANSAYTAKFKRLLGISNINRPSAAITAITGFVPGVGQSNSAGHMANTHIDVGGRNFTVEGSTLTANVFLDEVHATDFIIARTEEEVLGLFLNNSRIPYTDAGMQMLASCVRTVMQTATRAGLIAEDIDPATGEYEPAVVITVPSVFDVPESQRKARIAPAIQCRFRYAGAIHYSTINYQMTF